MSKGSAIISILIAFVAGLAIGNLLGGGVGGEEELAEIGPETGAVEAIEDDVERLRAEVPENAPQRGPDDALVTIVMWSDYQCPFCKRAEPTVSRLLNEHPDDLRVVWRDNPLPFHDNAMPAAIAAREAHEQGGDEKFWEMHDLLFENNQSLGRADLERYAQQIGLNMEQFRAALDDNEHRDAIQADQRAAQQLGARGTPAFFINGRQLMGAQPYDRFNQIVTEELANARALVERGTDRNRLYASLMAGAATEPTPEEPEPSKQPERQRRQPDPEAIYRVPLHDSPSKGPDDALVTIVEFSEFQCPFCSRVLGTVDQIRERYGDDVRVVFKHNPLPFHDNAMPAAQAAVEVQEQLGDEAFWQFHDTLFENQRQLSRENLEQWASELRGIDMAQFRAALDNNEHREAIQRDQQLARSLGASGTPAFFINGRNLRGAQPFPAFQSVIDEELARARAALEEGVSRGELYQHLIADGATSPQFVGGEAAAPERPERPDADRVYEIEPPRNAPTRGAGRNAPVTIQIFSDFQCPFCNRVRPTLDQVEERFGNRVHIIWRDYPLPFHDNAMPAAQAAQEVFEQGGSEKFWAYHDLLFENQRSLDRASLERFAAQVGGIDMAQFRAALDNNEHQAAIRADMQAVQEAGARIGTPSFFINGRLLQGAQPFPAFEAAINRALEEE
ncbi:MAG TPA: thioredoxin domain-containing protein [Sandaracinaceae bacterium LLY-WYZ-13_1]|nr:thioredoxin domain-containing protein [Sandaracinaceae bacterium LLY-WYZ-13_1]